MTSRTIGSSAVTARGVNTRLTSARQPVVLGRVHHDDAAEARISSRVLRERRQVDAVRAREPLPVAVGGDDVGEAGQRVEAVALAEVHRRLVAQAPVDLGRVVEVLVGERVELDCGRGHVALLIGVGLDGVQDVVGEPPEPVERLARSRPRSHDESRRRLRPRSGPMSSVWLTSPCSVTSMGSVRPWVAASSASSVSDGPSCSSVWFIGSHPAPTVAARRSAARPSPPMCSAGPRTAPASVRTRPARSRRRRRGAPRRPRSRGARTLRSLRRRGRRGDRSRVRPPPTPRAASSRRCRARAGRPRGCRRSSQLAPVTNGCRNPML